MAAMINVDGSDDPSYRYKMPRLVSKVEGRGNGVKTVLVNCTEVAKALNRSSAQVTKFFGCDLGAMTKYDEKIERCLVNGAFENKVLQEALTGFIQKFVLCPSCGNPETIQELKGKKKSATVVLKCKACGALEEADNAHKLITFIVKEMSPDEAGNKKELRKKKRAERTKKKDGSESAENSVDEEKKKKKKKKKKDKDGTEKKKKKKRDREKASQANSSIPGGESEGKEPEDLSSSDSENGDWNDEDDFGAMTVHDVAVLNGAVTKVQKALAAGAENTALLQLVDDEQINGGLARNDKISILFFGIFNSETPLATTLGKIALEYSVIAEVKDCYKTPLDVETELLLCLEEAPSREISEEAKQNILKMVPMVLKALYDEDLVQEKTILDWYKGSLACSSYKHVRTNVAEDDLQVVKDACAPIIEWLENAESDSSDSE